ncbi:MAG: hypothetical protein PHW31_01565 [Candidatus Pacebacteria bacterium]|nr:hypothetical protein [Candidatus Paceibacterota bacterium]
MKPSVKKILSVILLILLGVAGRIFFVEVIKVPNLEIITALSLLAGFSLGGVFSFLTPLAIIFLSDWFIGNNAILIFTWSAFGIIGLLGIVLRRKGKLFVAGLPPHQKAIQSLFWCGGFGILAACFFFLYTNFGWWVLSGMYPYTWWGILACYANGLPFFKTNLLGSLIFTPIVFGAFFAVKKFLYSSRVVMLSEAKHLGRDSSPAGSE